MLGKSVSEGRVYFFSKDCPVGIRGHMHVCIKHHDEYLVFSTCSSQVTSAVKLARIRGYNVNTYPVIAPSKENGFDELTYINCNQVWILTEKEFGYLYKTCKIVNTRGNGNIDAVGMALIANGIKLSTEIADEIKELF